MWFDTIFSVILSNGSPSRNAMTGYQIDVIRYLSYWARISFSSIRKYKYLDAAPLSSPSFIDLTWQPILSSFEERRGKPRTLPLMATDMASFSSYFERTWIGTSSTHPTYRHEMWNMPNLKNPPLWKGGVCTFFFLVGDGLKSPADGNTSRSLPRVICQQKDADSCFNQLVRVTGNKPCLEKIVVLA